MTDASDCPAAARLEHFVARPAASDADTARHLATCPRCRDLVDEIRANNDLVSELLAGGAGEVSRSACPDDAPRIEGYELLEEIGRGGQGVLYKARQLEPGRIVAVKVLRADAVSTARGERRFEREIELIANLQHPGIVVVHDSGRAGDGRCFFAMELIEGCTLREHVERRRPGTRQRLELMADICRAVHHAHQHGVVHRDLKPANILVTADGRAKVLDFGVARITDHDLAHTTLQTELGQLVGTIPYMSPEQVTGDSSRIDARSDVYALGVVTFEVLTGRLPYDLHGRMIPEALRVIREDDPASLASIDRAYRGDLDTIVRTALEKEPARRYQSAHELAADLDRSLKDEAIAAHPPSSMYQLRKFARRNRGLVGGGLTTFAALIIGMVASVAWAMKASASERLAVERADEAESIASFLEDLLTSASPERLGREALVSDVLDVASLTVDAFADRPLVEGRLRKAIGATYVTLGLGASAVEHLERAAAIYDREHGPEHDDTRHVLHDLASAYRYEERYEDAEGIYVDLVPLQIRLGGESHEDTLGLRNNQAVMYVDAGRIDEARALFEQTLGLARASLGNAHDVTFTAMNGLAGVLLAEGDPESARPLFVEALEGRAQRSGVPDFRVATVMNNLAAVHAEMQQLDEAERLYRRSLELIRETLGDEHEHALSAMANLVGIQVDLGRYAEAEPLARAAATLSLRVRGDESRVTLNLHNTLGAVLVQLDRRDEAIDVLRPNLERIRRLLGPEHDRTLAAMHNLAGLYDNLGRFDDSEPLHRASLEVLRRKLGDEHERTLTALYGLGRMFHGRGKLEEAIGLYEQTLAIQRRTLGDGDRATLATENILGEALMSLRRFEEAETHLARAAEGAQRSLGADHPFTGFFMMSHGRGLTFLGRFEEAEATGLAAHAILVGRLGPKHEHTTRAVKCLVELYDHWQKPARAAEWQARLAE